MSSDGPPTIANNDAAPTAPADNQFADGVLHLGDNLARLGALLRERAEEVSALESRATSAEDRCAALEQRHEERERELVALRDQLDQVNARVAEFQAAGGRHLAEIQSLTKDYAQRVAESERASDGLRSQVAALHDQLAAQQERNAKLEQRIAAASALESRVSEAIQGIGHILDELRTHGDADSRPIQPAPVLAPPGTTTLAGPIAQPAPARGWYGRGRKAK